MAEAAKKSRNKIYAAGVVGFLAIISILYYMSAPVYLYVIAYMWFGFVYGILQQYGRFCFASAWRDLIMVKVPRMFVGIMIGLMTLSIINAYVVSIYPDKYVVDSIGFHVLLGGLLFGLGMVLAGGCATGSLYKTGEGNMISLVVLLTLSFSQAIFAATLMDSFTANFITGHTWNNISLTTLLFGGVTDGKIPQYSFVQHLLGDSLINAILVSILLLIAVYIIWVRKPFIKRRTQALSTTAAATADGGTVKMGFKDELAGFWSMISASKRTTIAAILIGIVAAAQIFTLAWIQNRDDFTNFGQVLAGKPASGGPAPSSWPQGGNGQSVDSGVSKNNTVFDPGYWYITTQEAMAAGWTINSAGVNMKDNNYFGAVNGLPKPWNSPALLLSFGLILGATFKSLLAREFKWKFPTRELFIYAVIGGTLMGIGARVGLGCNIGAFYGPAAFGNPSGWIFFIGMGLGAFLSAQAVNYFANKKMAKQVESMDFDIEL
ncbi:MAG: YeeE/YedE thiosulfate transporter family protein [Thermoleophilia bacterium]